ncbi:MAG TPA: bifunctional DNA-binding transcriptional regulator/O6-methylguanine-DNA methyltransferase Ada [Gemmatimonadales bacterium]
MSVPAFQSLTDNDRWLAVLSRDRQLNASFVYAVRSTGIYCRVGCPSRRPRRPQVEFFPVPAAAEQAGYRACRRCRPREVVGRDPQVALVERACRLLEQAGGERVTLAALGRALRVSAPHLQRVFTRVTGVSPRSYADTLRSGRLRASLKSGATVSRALYDAGYGSPSRVYEDRAASIGMTPATYREGGAGQRMAWATEPTPLGRVLVAATPRGLCFVSLGDSDQVLEQALAAEFPRALRVRDDKALRGQVREVVERISGRVPHQDLPLDIRATAFQRAVWQELRQVPAGTTVTYAELARRIGRPSAVRAVANAVASNNLAVVVPCHRVVRSDGELGGYRWGPERKRRLLQVEGG